MVTELRVELQQSRPFESLEQEAYLAIVRTAAVLEHALAEALKPYGITPTQYNVLRILRGAGADGLCRNDVRSRMVAPVPDATRLLDRLEAAGLIQRARDGADRRFVTTRISDQGLDLLDDIDESVSQIHRLHLGHLGKQKNRDLIDTLAAVRESLKKEE